MTLVMRSLPPNMQTMPSARRPLGLLVRKSAARTALVGLNEPQRILLAECFRQFGIECVVVASDAAERLKKEKFEACVVGLNAGAETLEAARSSPSNSRCVIFGIGGDARDTMRFSKYGINAMFHEPLERATTVKLIRATRPLLVHEFRRYTRIPVVVEVSVSGEGRRVSGSTIELSAGGMSVTGAQAFPAGAAVELSFALMPMPRVSIRGSISWSNTPAFGVRFDREDPRRLHVRTWIDSHLEHS
jgi:PilZ domain